MKRFNPTLLSAAPAATNIVPITPAAPADERPPVRTAPVRDWEAERRSRDLLFVEHYGQPGAEMISVPDGMMAITLSLKFDNSDSMSDYFDRHASLGPDFLIGIVKKQAQTERLARKWLQDAALGRAELPPLANWKWKTEKYSMGHGNYLESTGIELPPALKGLQTAYRGGPVTHAHWEVEFSYPQKFLPHATYGKTLANNSKMPSASAGGMTITATRHTKKGYPIWVVQLGDRVERPEFERLRDQAKALGGWYSSYRGGGAIPGFTFKDEASAKTFVEGRQSKVESEPPSTLDVRPSTQPDVYACADCGREFESGEARDEHFMSPDCPRHAPIVIPVSAPVPEPVSNIVTVNFAPVPPKRPNPLLARARARL